MSMRVSSTQSRPALAVTPFADLGAIATTEQVLRRRAELTVGHPGRAKLRSRAIEANLPMARKLARRYVGRGEQFDDLAQVAALALVKAVDGYDPERQVPFVGYAVPCIVGALKRHFRDAGWAMRVPRSTQELVLRVRTATAELGQQLGRPPTPAELGCELGVSVDDVLAARLAAQSYRSDSLDGPSTDNDDFQGGDSRHALGVTDRSYLEVDNRLAIHELLAAMPVRERRILTMRFYDEMTQTLIAGEIGVSQMQVSRLLKQSLGRLRLALEVSGWDSPMPVPV